jgi:hypothetical protein
VIPSQWISHSLNFNASPTDIIGNRAQITTCGREYTSSIPLWMEAPTPGAIESAKSHTGDKSNAVMKYLILFSNSQVTEAGGPAGSSSSSRCSSGLSPFKPQNATAFTVAFWVTLFALRTCPQRLTTLRRGSLRARRAGSDGSGRDHRYR